MLLIRMIQKLVAALNSEGTPGQVAAGIALGAAFGLTPLINLHNVAVLVLVMCLNVSFPGAMLGWVVFTPVGFVLDPVFDSVGASLLAGTPELVPAWTALYNIPVVPLSNYNNTVVLGSLVGWIALSIPTYLMARWGVARYRTEIYARLQKTRALKAVKASKLYNLYRLFRPGQA